MKENTLQQHINIPMSREQLCIIRAAYSSWLDRQEVATKDLLEVESLLNKFYE